MSKKFLPDANILIYAFQSRAPQHEPCRNWLLSALESEAELIVPTLVEVAFVRISTSPALRTLAASMTEALAFRDKLLDCPGVSRAFPGTHHDGIFRELLTKHKIAGNTVNDA